MISEKAELHMGQEAKKQIVKEYGLYENLELKAYIDEVGAKITANCERKNLPIEFVVLNTPLVNAFAVPGVVFVTRGILDLIDDEAELAGVIGHEMGHITNFHSVKLIQKQYGYGFLATFAAVAGTIYSPKFEDSRSYAAYYDTLYRGIGLVTAGFLSGYGRKFELEADHSGLRYAVWAGYDPDAMISFFKRMDVLSRDQTSGIELFLRTHPPTRDRIRQTQKELALVSNSPALVKKGFGFEKRKKMAEILTSTSTRFEDNFDRYQEITRNIPRLDSESQGILEGSLYRHPSLNISLEVPQGWNLERSYGKALVKFTTADGKAQGELQYKRFANDPYLLAHSTSQIAGVSLSTSLMTAENWAQSVESNLQIKKRTGRKVQYLFGEAYAGTYYGMDRVGRPAFIKIYFIVRGDRGDRGDSPKNQEGFVIFFGAPADKYLDYLVDSEKIVSSFKTDSP